MAPAAAYDDIADWYEEEFLGGQRTGARARDGNPLDLGHILRDLLGEGGGTCLEVGCGTGVHAAQVRELGWTPVGVDMTHRLFSYGTLRHSDVQAALFGRAVPTTSDALRGHRLDWLGDHRSRGDRYQRV
jgi:predicted TPR repeat methyltransferase